MPGTAGTGVYITFAVFRLASLGSVFPCLPNVIHAMLWKDKTARETGATHLTMPGQAASQDARFGVAERQVPHDMGGRVARPRCLGVVL